MEQDNEGLILEAVRGGDKEAFRELVNPIIPRAYRIALTILRSSHLAEEAVQNALIELYRTIMAGKEIRNILGWFSRLITNRSIDLLRQEQNHNAGVDIAEIVMEDQSDSPVEALIKKENTMQLLEAVMSLDEQQRVIVVLYYFQGLKIEEIASFLNIKEATVKTRLFRARQKLSCIISDRRLNAKVVKL